MLQKLNSKRAGFTLVEIMIVVSIIALLAAIAVPNALRARKRSQAASIVQTLRMLDSAKDQYAIDSGLKKGATPAPAGLAGYVKTGTKLYTQLSTTGIVLDEIGNTIVINVIDTAPTIDTDTHNNLDDVLGGVGSQEAITYWGPHF